MAKDKPLFLYEEIMLLVLRDEQGTVATGFPEQVVAGAILAELLLDGRISVEDTRKKLVDLKSSKPTGEPILDECLERITASKRRASLKIWVQRMADTKNLRHNVARQLCDRGILRADEDKVLFLFTRKIYPEVNPLPERKLINRMREAIFSDHSNIDPRTIMLISLANGSELLRDTFGAKDVKARKKRIEQIANGELAGKATNEVIAACQTAVMIATMMPVMVSTTVHN
jgi:Golgi phosphoprotein 3